MHDKSHKMFYILSTANFGETHPKKIRPQGKKVITQKEIITRLASTSYQQHNVLKD